MHCISNPEVRIWQFRTMKVRLMPPWQYDFIFCFLFLMSCTTHTYSRWSFSDNRQGLLHKAERPWLWNLDGIESHKIWIGQAWKWYWSQRITTLVKCHPTVDMIKSDMIYGMIHFYIIHLDFVSNLVSSNLHQQQWIGCISTEMVGCARDTRFEFCCNLRG